MLTLNMALDYAEKHKLPLVVAGDLHDSKAVLRAECVDAIIKTIKSHASVRVLVIPGNHCMQNEKGSEHALNFLKPYCEVIDYPVYDDYICAWLIPYYSDTQELLKLLKITPNGHPLIMHQGVMGADMGSYVIDKSSLPKEAFKNFRVISGHYHKRQDIVCKKTTSFKGIFSYIGSPYTISFAEANDSKRISSLIRRRKSRICTLLILESIKYWRAGSTIYRIGYHIKL